VTTERLRRIPLFAEADEEQLRAISLIANAYGADEGEVLVTEGHWSFDFMILEEGSAAVVQGEERLAVLGPGDAFGEIGVLRKDRSKASVIATTPCRVLALTSWDLLRLRRRLPEAFDLVVRTSRSGGPFAATG
jgi:CRP-like cAMP-binding protein